MYILVKAWHTAQAFILYTAFHKSPIEARQYLTILNGSDKCTVPIEDKKVYSSCKQDEIVSFGGVYKESINKWRCLE